MWHSNSLTFYACLNYNLNFILTTERTVWNVLLGAPPPFTRVLLKESNLISWELQNEFGHQLGFMITDIK